MVVRHNERTIAETIAKATKARLAALAAAYGVSAPDTAATRRELTRLLLAAEREYSPRALAAHQATVAAAAEAATAAVAPRSRRRSRRRSRTGRRAARATPGRSSRTFA